MAKYKIKTHSGAKRRIYRTGSGKLLRRKGHINNSRRKKRGETLRKFNSKMPVSEAQVKRLRRLMPYK